MVDGQVDLGDCRPALAGMPHELDVLWRELGAVVRAIDPDHLTTLDGDQGDFVSVMHAADEGSFQLPLPGPAQRATRVVAIPGTMDTGDN